MLATVSGELTELSDMQALRQFRDELEEFIAQKSASEDAPKRPSEFVKSQILVVENVVQNIYKAYDSMIAVGDGPSGETRGSISHGQLVARKESLEKAKVDLPTIQRHLLGQFQALAIVGPDGVPSFHDDLAAFLLYNRPDSILLRQQPVNLHLANVYAFVNSRGPLQKAIQAEFQKKTMNCVNLLKLFEEQKTKLETAQVLCGEGKPQEAEGLIKGMKKVFSDLDYSGVAESIKLAKPKPAPKAALENQVPVPAEARTSETTQKSEPKTNRLWFWIVLAVIAVVIAIVFLKIAL